MSYSLGDTVVHPNHGVAIIEQFTTRVMKGEEREFMVLRVVDQDLTIMVLPESVQDIGLRDVVGQKGLDQVFAVLRATDVEEPTNWSRRYKANNEKIHTGDLIKIAEVVRDLSRRNGDRGLSQGEKQILLKARRVLVTEVALAEQTNEDKAEALLDDILTSA